MLLVITIKKLGKYQFLVVYIKWYYTNIIRIKNTFLYDGAYKYNYGQIRVLFDSYKKKSNMNYTIHETRHTYTSRLRLRGADSTFTKKLTGHSVFNVDEDTYTHISIGDLYKIVNDAFEEDMKYVG